MIAPKQEYNIIIDDILCEIDGSYSLLEFLQYNVNTEYFSLSLGERFTILYSDELGWCFKEVTPLK